MFVCGLESLISPLTLWLTGAWLVQVGSYFMSPDCSVSFFILPHNPEELMESLCLFCQCQHTHTHTYFLPLCFSLSPSLL